MFGEVSVGGGISNASGGSLIITNSTISGNTSSAAYLDVFGGQAVAYGGGVDNSGGCSMTITNCTISGNAAVGETSSDTGMAAEFRMVAIFKLRAVRSYIILQQVETVHSAVGLMDIRLREQKAVS